MFNLSKMNIKNKILSGYFVVSVLCLVMAGILFKVVGTSSSIGIIGIVVAVIAIVFGMGYGSYVAKLISESVNKAKHVTDELSKGHLSLRADVNTEDEVGKMAASLNHFCDLLQRDLIGTIDLIAEGNLNKEIEAKDEKDEIAVILQKISRTIVKINSGMGGLIQDVMDGKLDTRGDETLFNGIWSEFIGNINKLIVAFVNPINVTSEYVDRISKGDIPPRITDTYKGDFNIIKMNLNNCVDIMNGLLSETEELIAAAQQGELEKKGAAESFSGGWKKLIEDINLLLDTVVMPIREVSSTMQAVSTGNLEVAVKGRYEGEFGELVTAVNVTIERLHEVVSEISSVLGNISKGQIDIDEIKQFDGNFESISVSMNRIIESLNETLGDINTAAEQVSTGATQVADGSQMLAQGATEQAGSIEELTATVTEVAEQTRDNAMNANTANSLVMQVKEHAQQGNTQMGEMLDAMEQINEASANISKVIKVIDDMAFQTKILALNAAVEAARAGQHGKGFAVVAEEVRNLAAQSATAAKETTVLIEGSISRAKRGEEIANDTAKALQEIVDGVSEAAELISGIAISSNTQATGISQINIGINQVSEVVQTNSATSQESAASSEELSGQAELLKELVNQFTLKGSKNRNGQGKRRDNNFGMKSFEERDYYQPTGKKQIILSDSEFGKY